MIGDASYMSRQQFPRMYTRICRGMNTQERSLLVILSPRLRKTPEPNLDRLIISVICLPRANERYLNTVVCKRDDATEPTPAKGGTRLRGPGGSTYTDYLEKFRANMCRMTGGEGASTGKADD